MTDTGIQVDTPADLLKSAKDRRLVLFLGAGFSKNISPSIPDASHLISIAARHARIEGRLLATHASNDYMLVAEYLQIQHKLDDAIFELAALIHDKAFSVQSSRPHIQLTEIDCSAIFTTNWDSWIERAFEHQRLPYAVIRDIADLVAPRPSNAHGAGPQRPKLRSRTRVFPETAIAKYHGDLKSPQSIVFSIRSYFDRIIERSALDSLLENELFTKSFLFIGYSFSDPNLRLIWYKLLHQKRLLERIGSSATFPTSYLVTSGYNPVFNEWMLHLGIVPISLDPTPDKLKPSVEKLLDDIIGAQR